MSDSTEIEAGRAAAERLTFFSDAVTAIAMTLLALELPVPDELTGDSGAQTSHLITFFVEHTGEYVAFVISFVVIAVHWSTHFRVFRYLGTVSRQLVLLNLLWLLLIVITPFTTKIISLGDGNLLGFGIYAGAQALQFAVFAIMVLHLRRERLMRDGFDTARLRLTLGRGVVPMAVACAVSIPAYALVGPWAFVLWALAPMLAGTIGQWRERSSGRSPA